MLAWLLLSSLGGLAEGFSQLSFGAPGFMERIFFSPLIVVFLIFTATQALIPEEFAKAIGPGLLGVRIRDERQAFLVGLASGAGFAILENMLNEAADSLGQDHMEGTVTSTHIPGPRLVLARAETGWFGAFRTGWTMGDQI